MIFPIRTDSPLRGRPWMNWALLGVTIGVGVLEASTDQFRAPTWVAHAELSSKVPSLPTFLGYAFIHAGWLHVLENMLALYIFGNNINDRLGHVGYLAFYLAGAIFAGVGFVAADASGLPVIGASGAVMAVMGAYIARPEAAASPAPPRPPARPPEPPPDPNLQRICDLRAEINESIAHHNLPHAAILFLELRTLDPRQVLARQAQLDVANQLASQQ